MTFPPEAPIRWVFWRHNKWIRKSAKFWRRCRSATGGCCTRCFWKSAIRTRCVVSLVWIGSTCGSCCTGPNSRSSPYTSRTWGTNRRSSPRRETFIDGSSLFLSKERSPMNHDVVVRQKMAERYLLEELDPQQRDEFEEHLFDCSECAMDVRAGASFVEHSKRILAETTPETTRVLAPVFAPPTAGWFAWLRPAFAVPALALLLLVVGYQNLVTYPRLEQALHEPQVLPWASVNLGTWGAGGPA